LAEIASQILAELVVSVGCLELFLSFTVSGIAQRDSEELHPPVISA
jgi:hypothetical protein